MKRVNKIKEANYVTAGGKQSLSKEEWIETIDKDLAPGAYTWIENNLLCNKAGLKYYNSTPYTSTRVRGIKSVRMQVECNENGRVRNKVAAEVFKEVTNSSLAEYITSSEKTFKNTTPILTFTVSNKSSNEENTQPAIPGVDESVRFIFEFKDNNNQSKATDITAYQELAVIYAIIEMRETKKSPEEVVTDDFLLNNFLDESWRDSIMGSAEAINRILEDNESYSFYREKKIISSVNTRDNIFTLVKGIKKVEDFTVHYGRGSRIDSHDPSDIYIAKDSAIDEIVDYYSGVLSAKSSSIVTLYEINRKTYEFMEQGKLFGISLKKAGRNPDLVAHGYNGFLYDESLGMFVLKLPVPQIVDNSAEAQKTIKKSIQIDCKNMNDDVNETVHRLTMRDFGGGSYTIDAGRAKKDYLDGKLNAFHLRSQLTKYLGVEGDFSINSMTIEEALSLIEELDSLLHAICNTITIYITPKYVSNLDNYKYNPNSIQYANMFKDVSNYIKSQAQLDSSYYEEHSTSIKMWGIFVKFLKIVYQASNNGQLNQLFDFIVSKSMRNTELNAPHLKVD